MRGRNFFDDYDETHPATDTTPEAKPTPAEVVKEADEVKPEEVATPEVKEAETKPASTTEKEERGEENGISENE